MTCKKEHLSLLLKFSMNQTDHYTAIHQRTLEKMGSIPILSFIIYSADYHDIRYSNGCVLQFFYQSPSTMDIFDIPDDYKPEKPLTDEENDEIINYLKGHPLFLKELPEDITTNPHLVALQALMQEDPTVTATNLNKQGNARLQQGPNSPYYMKDAYAKYTEAINLNCPDALLNSKLHANRASINLKMKNYGKVVEDCKKSIAFDPTYLKAYYRLGKAYIGLRKYQQCIDLMKGQTNEELLTVSKQAQTLLTKSKGETEKMEKQQAATTDKISTYFSERKWKLGKRSEQLPEGVEIELVEGKISIPLVVIYPEFSQFDLIARTTENQSIGNATKQLFANPLPWDSKGEYVAGALEYYSEVEEAVLLKLPKQVTISELASRVPVRGALEIIILAKNKFAEHYKAQHKIF